MLPGSDKGKITIVVDTFGGDGAPDVVIKGVEILLSEGCDFNIILVGSCEQASELAISHSDFLAYKEATETIAMDEHPVEAVRRKRDSSIVVGCRQVREGIAHGFFSAGSTGACMAAATLEIGRVKGIQRPAIATILPTPTGGLVLLDSGANADARPEMLAQFAQMGTAYASLILGIEQPRLALLNIGGEASKGSALAIESYKLLEEQFSNFIGNVEGTALLSGVCDVVVTDGFTGNIALKLIEGTTSVLFREIKKVFTSKAKNKLAAAIVNNDLRALKDRFNAEAVGGAPLLGCKGAVVIGHGSSTAKAIANGIKLTAAIAGSRIADLLAGQNAQDSATATG